MTYKTYTFSLILHRLEADYEELEEAFYNAGCDDALLGMKGGIVYLDFDREAPSLEMAILSAIRDVESAEVGAKVAHVEPGDLVTAAEIARRIGQSRESVRLWMEGKRGPGNFPAPRTGISGKTMLWSWSDVLRWLVEHEKFAQEALHQAEVIVVINRILEETETRHEYQLDDSVVEQLKSLRLTA